MVVIFSITGVAAVVYMYFLPENEIPATFKCPLVPLVPCVGIAINMSMMTGLSGLAWARLAAWTFLGVLIYIFYGVQHSILNNVDDKPRDFDDVEGEHDKMRLMPETY